MAYTKPRQRKEEEGERLRGGRDQIKFIDLGFERWQVVRFRICMCLLFSVDYTMVSRIEDHSSLRAPTCLFK